MDDYGFPVGSKVHIKTEFSQEAVVTGHTKNVFGRPLVVVTEQFDDGFKNPGMVYYPEELELIS